MCPKHFILRYTDIILLLIDTIVEVRACRAICVATYQSIFKIMVGEDLRFHRCLVQKFQRINPDIEIKPYLIINQKWVLCNSGKKIL